MTLDPHQAAIRDAASRLGIAVTSASEDPDVLVLGRGRRSLAIRKGRRIPSLRADVEAMCDDKAACKARLSSIGIPVPAGIVIDREAPNQAAIEAHLSRGVAQVAKPLSGTHGEHVRLGIRTLEEVLAHARETPAGHRALVLEDQAIGRDLRIQAVAGRLLAACVREPAYVVGTGTDDVRALVDARRAVMSRQNPENRLELDEPSVALLREQGLAPDSVPAPGQRVQLDRLANVARGAIPVDVTDSVHPRYAEWVERIARTFPIELFAMDVITEAVDADPERAANVIEINARPEWLHHTFSAGRTHDVPAAILRWLFEI